MHGLAFRTDPGTQVFASAATIWPATTKQGLGNLERDGSPAQAADASDFPPLAVRARHAEAVTALPDLHRDRFDRLVTAQARGGGPVVVAGAERLPTGPVGTLDAWRGPHRGTPPIPPSGSGCLGSLR